MHDHPPKTLLQTTKTAILTASADGHITWANTASEQLFEHSLSYLQGLNINHLLQPTDNETVTPSNFVYLKKDKTLSSTPIVSHDQWIAGVHQPLFVDYSISPLIDSKKVDNDKVDGEKSGQVQHDNISNQSQPAQASTLLIEIWSKDRHHRISQDQHTQQQYTLARNMLRSVAHEVKNPLAGIRGAGQLLKKLLTQHSTSANTQKVQTYTDLIISETDRLSGLIDQLLGIKRPANKQPLNVHEPIEHVLQLNTSEMQHIKIIRDYDISIPNITADNEQLIQVFLNLINNAIEAIQRQLAELEQPNKECKSHKTAKATDKNYQPCITLQTRVEFSRTIDKTLHKKVAKISIIDNGIGIDKGLMEQIFFPLVTSRAQGTGLGLALVNDIIQQHQGQIKASSDKHKTCFTLYLPFEQAS